jgi:hypothetical protein
MRDDLGKLAWFDAVVEREVEVVGHFSRLITRDEGSHGNDATVSWRERRAFPQIAKRALRVLLERRHHHPNVVNRTHRLRLLWPGARLVPLSK